MPEVCESLVGEHVVILRVLDFLERETAHLDSGAAVRRDFFTDAIAFVREFTDGIHHKKEEGILFPQMVAAGVPMEGGPIGVMLYERDQGRGHPGRLRRSGHQGGDREAALLGGVAPLNHGPWDGSRILVAAITVPETIWSRPRLTRSVLVRIVLLLDQVLRQWFGCSPRRPMDRVSDVPSSPRRARPAVERNRGLCFGIPDRNRADQCRVWQALCPDPDPDLHVPRQPTFLHPDRGDSVKNDSRPPI